MEEDRAVLNSEEGGRIEHARVAARRQLSKPRCDLKIRVSKRKDFAQPPIQCTKDDRLRNGGRLRNDLRTH